MQVRFQHLSEIDLHDILLLMNDPLVRRHMPLLEGDFDSAACRDFVRDKESLWRKHGYGPWAFVIGDRFIGWGGLQPEAGEPDLGIVLLPSYWGLGEPICREILRRGFEEMGFEAITLLLPASRTRWRGVHRLGFVADGSVELQGEAFRRFRLDARTYAELASGHAASVKGSGDPPSG